MLLGEGRLRVLFWEIYDASLYATNGVYDPEKPFALSLTYLRGFSDLTSRNVLSTKFEVRGSLTRQC